MKTHKQFSLHCTDESFQERQKNVFDQIFEIEKASTAKKEELMDVDVRTKLSGKRSETKPFRGKESIFKMPQDPVPRNFLKRLPDYKKNPHKWTKYSLEDVKDEDISDRANTKAALSFLKELNERSDKLKEEKFEETSDVPKRIIFQKHTQTSISEEISDDVRPSFSSSKIVMPEYVVGQKIKKEKKNKSMKLKNRNKELRLDHLLQEDEIE